jgi:hypothetical protein
MVKSPSLVDFTTMTHNVKIDEISTMLEEVERIIKEGKEPRRIEEIILEE